MRIFLCNYISDKMWRAFTGEVSRQFHAAWPQAELRRETRACGQLPTGRLAQPGVLERIHSYSIRTARAVAAVRVLVIIHIKSSNRLVLWW